MEEVQAKRPAGATGWVNRAEVIGVLSSLPGSISSGMTYVRSPSFWRVELSIVSFALGRGRCRCHSRRNPFARPAELTFSHPSHAGYVSSGGGHPLEAFRIQLSKCTVDRVGH